MYRTPDGRDFFASAGSTESTLSIALKDYDAARRYKVEQLVGVSDIEKHTDELAELWLDVFKRKNWEEESQIRDDVLFPIAKQKALRMLFEQNYKHVR